MEYRAGVWGDTFSFMGDSTGLGHTETPSTTSSRRADSTGYTFADVIRILRQHPLSLTPEDSLIAREFEMLVTWRTALAYVENSEHTPALLKELDLLVVPANEAPPFVEIRNHTKRRVTVYLSWNVDEHTPWSCASSFAIDSYGVELFEYVRYGLIVTEAEPGRTVERACQFEARRSYAVVYDHDSAPPCYAFVAAADDRDLPHIFAIPADRRR